MSEKGLGSGAVARSRFKTRRATQAREIHKVLSTDNPTGRDRVRLNAIWVLRGLPNRRPDRWFSE